MSASIPESEWEWYETMVFRIGEERCTAEDCNCGLPVVADWGEVDSDGYNVRGDAHRGHLAMCRKYAALYVKEPA